MSVLVFVVSALLLLSTACQGSSPTPEPTDVQAALPTPTPALLSYVTTDPPENSLTSLRCEECRAVDVLEVTGPETLLTSEGAVRLYGAFVAPEEESCVVEATARLTELAGTQVRLESGYQDTDSGGTLVRYIYTESGDSIDELFVIEGIARASSYDGPHSPWILITADKARRGRSGCIWENYNNLFPERTPRSSGGVN